MNEPVFVHQDDRAWETWPDAEVARRGRILWRTLLSDDVTPSEALTLGVARLASGEALHAHRHEQAEAYFFLAGSCVVTVDNEAHTVGSGTAVFIPGNSVHSCRNAGAEDAEFVYVIAADSFADVEYVFSA